MYNKGWFCVKCLEGSYIIIRTDNSTQQYKLDLSEASGRPFWRSISIIVIDIAIVGTQPRLRHQATNVVCSSWKIAIETKESEWVEVENKISTYSKLR